MAGKVLLDMEGWISWAGVDAEGLWVRKVPDIVLVQPPPVDLGQPAWGVDRTGWRRVWLKEQVPDGSQLLPVGLVLLLVHVILLQLMIRWAGMDIPGKLRAPLHGQLVHYGGQLVHLDLLLLPPQGIPGY